MTDKTNQICDNVESAVGIGTLALSGTALVSLGLATALDVMREGLSTSSSAPEKAMIVAGAAVAGVCIPILPALGAALLGRGTLETAKGHGITLAALLSNDEPVPVSRFAKAVGLTVLGAGVAAAVYGTSVVLSKFGVIFDPTEGAGPIQHVVERICDGAIRTDIGFSMVAGAALAADALALASAAVTDKIGPRDSKPLSILAT